MKYVLDAHTHTIASGHAYSTIREMAKAASEKGLELLGITEHSMKRPGTCQLFYFENLKMVDREMYGVELYMGTELNIMDYEGRVDMGEKTLEKMDIVIASMHVPCIKPGTREENTNAYLEVMKNPYLHIIGHPDDARYEVDYLALVQSAKEHRVLLEVNNNSLDPRCGRQGGEENIRIMLKYCREYQAPVIVNSDAHTDTLVGCHDYVQKILDEMGFPEELIVNRNVDEFKKYVNKDKIL